MARDLSYVQFLDSLAAANPGRKLVTPGDDTVRQRIIAARRERERQRELKVSTIAVRELARRSGRPVVDVLDRLAAKGAPQYTRDELGQRRYPTGETLAWLEKQPRRGPTGPALAVIERSRDVVAALRKRRVKLQGSLATARTSAATARVEGDDRALREARERSREIETALAELEREIAEWTEAAANVDRDALREAQSAVESDANALADAAMAAGRKQLAALESVESAVKALGVALAAYHGATADAADAAQALVELAMPGKSEHDGDRRLRVIDDMRDLAGRSLMPVGLHRMLVQHGVRFPDGPVSGEPGATVLEQAQDRLGRFERRLNAHADKVAKDAEEEFFGKGAMLVKVPTDQDVDAIARGEA